jgi:hypothetical protein
MFRSFFPTAVIALSLLLTSCDESSKLDYAKFEPGGNILDLKENRVDVVLVANGIKPISVSGNRKGEVVSASVLKALNVLSVLSAFTVSTDACGPLKFVEPTSNKFVCENCSEIYSGSWPDCPLRVTGLPATWKFKK